MMNSKNLTKIRGHRNLMRELINDLITNSNELEIDICKELINYHLDEMVRLAKDEELDYHDRLTIRI